MNSLYQSKKVSKRLPNQFDELIYFPCKHSFFEHPSITQIEAIKE